MHLSRRLLIRLAALCLVLAAPLASAHEGHAPVEGVDYVRIADGRPLASPDGRIEVVEIFSYACGHCADLHPLIEPWQRALPDDVRFSYLPVVYRPDDAFATAYFAAEEIGALEQTHAATFDAMHRARRLPRNATTAELAWFYEQLGVDRARLDAAMTSAQTRQKLNDARDFLLRSGAQGTPTLIINGRYRVQARSLRELLHTAEQLIAAERQAGG
ncbi:thiol:disulfide interchange protein DsbA/DsbL [Luteimonas sp. YGD11-2]|uniref:thiol:disulfide interchange protein DsbA/DsbL n=1 Tax=Luteimonas sp. YGD11-2 TaxID=2508168 RepID=UPI00100B4FFD|nr:thiol:disulfide interchange protein DsbA/DsbL [Luteimonas sp. YGD11-2]